jgi:large subunit ribosomal protein L24e
MKRIAEIKQKREHAFWKHRMAASREKLRAHRKKKISAKTTSVKLVEPLSMEAEEPERIREKIKVSARSRSALIPGEGRSMGMDID